MAKNPKQDQTFPGDDAPNVGDPPVQDLTVDDGDQHPSDEDLAAAQPATDADKVPAADGDAGKAQLQKTVPHGAFEKERQQRKAIQRELETERRANAESRASLQGKLDLLNQAFQPPPQQPPSPDQDIFGAFNHLNTEVTTLRQERQQEQQRQRQATEQNQRMAQMTGAYQADAARFSAEQPDFNDAYQYLINSRAKELSTVGYDHATVQNAIRNDELNIIGFAMQQGASPAETVYRLAQARGYAPAQGQQGNSGAPTSNGSGQARMQQLQRAQDASTTLSKAGGSAGGVRLTLDSIDRMPQKEFEALVRAKNSKDPNGFDDFVRRLELGNNAN